MRANARMPAQRVRERGFLMRVALSARILGQESRLSHLLPQDPRVQTFSPSSLRPGVQAPSFLLPQTRSPGPPAPFTPGSRMRGLTPVQSRGDTPYPLTPSFFPHFTREAGGPPDE